MLRGANFYDNLQELMSNIHYGHTKILMIIKCTHNIIAIIKRCIHVKRGFTLINRSSD